MPENKYPAQQSSTLIRDMAIDERPREKALKHGVKVLSDAELMALLSSTGITGMSVIDLCRKILKDFDNHLSKLARQPASYLMGQYSGIGPAKAITLLAALELGARAAADHAKVDNPVIRSAAAAADCMRHYFSNIPHEEVWIMHLAQNGKVIIEERVSEGGMSSAAVDIKKVLKSALNHYSSTIIMFHNHPSGSLVPSGPDDNLTRRVQEGCKAIDIRFNDHIIVTETGYYSYFEQGKL